MQVSLFGDGDDDHNPSKLALFVDWFLHRDGKVDTTRSLLQVSDERGIATYHRSAAASNQPTSQVLFHIHCFTFLKGLLILGGLLLVGTMFFMHEGKRDGR